MSTEIKTLSKTEWAICRELALELVKMVPFYGTVYKSSLYDLIVPFPACELGAEREERRAVVFASGKNGKSE